MLSRVMQGRDRRVYRLETGVSTVHLGHSSKVEYAFNCVWSHCMGTSVDGFHSLCTWLLLLP